MTCVRARSCFGPQIVRADASMDVAAARSARVTWSCARRPMVRAGFSHLRGGEPYDAVDSLVTSPTSVVAVHPELNGESA